MKHRIRLRKRPERTVVQRLSGAFLLTGKTAKTRTERVATSLLMPGACENCDPADIHCESCDRMWPA